MASLIHTDPALHLEIEQEFGDLQLELVHCDVCGDYHPPELHLTRATLFDDEEPAEV
jgi:hypothetical protein